jgi:hypothetical protein
MDRHLQERLNQIPDKILSEGFLQGKGLGNEIAFWIFDYDAAAELQVRESIESLEIMLGKMHSHLKVVHINLLRYVVDYLTERNFIDKAIKLQRQKGDEALLRALAGPLHMSKFAPYLMQRSDAANKDLVFISGVGSVWPMLRSHNLLNTLHAELGDKPLVLFYPGVYDGQTMKLFGEITRKNYYRAFKLVA